MIFNHTKKIMENKDLGQYVEILVERAIKKGNTGRLTGNETIAGAGAILRTFPRSGLTQEDAEYIANAYNAKIEEAEATRAAEQYAKEGVTAEEVEYEGNGLESTTPEVAQDRENEEQK